MEKKMLPLTSVSDGVGQDLLPDLYCLPVKIVNICLFGNPAETKEWVLIDAGMPKSADAILAAAEERFGPESKLKAVILTHGHFDHVGALKDLLKDNNVSVYAHELELPYLTGKADYPPADPTVGGGLISELSPSFPHEGIDLGMHIHSLPSDGTVPEMPGWRWVHTPGHTPGHISLFREQDRVLIAGDAFVTVKQESLYKVITQDQEISGPPKYFTTDWDQAWNSVKLLRDLHPLLAITGHGWPMADDLLETSLETLVENFQQIGIPEQGRYVDPEDHMYQDNI
jgi:glyoxylase-like metal-dependent hydrolase (beta-lactamase superfamily II)